MARREEYRRFDGTLSSSRKKDVILISPYTVEQFARALAPSLDARYFVGTAEVETNFAVNEIDTEESGFVSKGLYQISDEENAKVNGTNRVELLDPIQSTETFYRLTKLRLRLCHEAGAIQFPDIYAYLGLCHNEGDSAGPRSIKNYGCNWSRYKSRNLENATRLIHTASNPAELAKAEKELGRVLRISRYGDACISGGSRYGAK